MFDGFGDGYGDDVDWLVAVILFWLPLAGLCHLFVFLALLTLTCLRSLGLAMHDTTLRTEGMATSRSRARVTDRERHVGNPLWRPWQDDRAHADSLAAGPGAIYVDTFLTTVVAVRTPTKWIWRARTLGRRRLCERRRRTCVRRSRPALTERPRAMHPAGSCARRRRRGDRQCHWLQSHAWEHYVQTGYVWRGGLRRKRLPLGFGTYANLHLAEGMSSYEAIHGHADSDDRRHTRQHCSPHGRGLLTRRHWLPSCGVVARAALLMILASLAATRLGEADAPGPWPRDAIGARLNGWKVAGSLDEHLVNHADLVRASRVDAFDNPEAFGDCTEPGYGDVGWEPGLPSTAPPSDGDIGDCAFMDLDGDYDLDDLLCGPQDGGRCDADMGQARAATQPQSAHVTGPTFIPSATFAGAVDTMVFKTGELGTGYYTDAPPPPVAWGLAALAATRRGTPRWRYRCATCCPS